MIRFALRCACGSEFESWFPSGASFDKQSRGGLIQCPRCGSAKIAKAPMAPAVVGPAREREARALSRVEVRQAMQTVRREIEANTKDVGKDFPQEARAMHAGLTAGAPIRGVATLAEARALIEEGVPVLPIPPIPDEMN
jgi:hypothetical protein